MTMLRGQCPEATARFLLALSTTRGLSDDLLLAEPAFEILSAPIEKFIADRKSGASLTSCFEPWLGDWSQLADLSAQHGVLDDWLEATSRCLSLRLPPSSIVHIWLSVFTLGSIPLAISVPGIAHVLGSADADVVADRIKEGQTLASVVKDWPAYTSPIIEWLAIAEGQGEIQGFQSRLAQLLLNRQLSWPLRVENGFTNLICSSLSLISFGLGIGRSLDEIVNDLSNVMSVAPWWKQLEHEYIKSHSLANAFGSACVLTPLGCAILNQAEQAGRMEEGLSVCREKISSGLLYQISKDNEESEVANK